MIWLKHFWATANGGGNGNWKEKLKKTFAKEHGKQWFDTHIDALEKNRLFLEAQSFLFSPAQKNSRS